MSVGRLKIAEPEFMDCVREAVVCGYCGSEQAVVMDHVVPAKLRKLGYGTMPAGVVRPDDGLPAYEKIPACWTCNSSKGRRTALEWVASTIKRLREGQTVPYEVERAAWRLSCPGAWL